MNGDCTKLETQTRDQLTYVYIGKHLAKLLPLLLPLPLPRVVNANQGRTNPLVRPMQLCLIVKYYLVYANYALQMRFTDAETCYAVALMVNASPSIPLPRLPALSPRK